LQLFASQIEDISKDIKRDSNFVFLAIHQHFDQSNQSLMQNWNQIKEISMRLCEWYNDRTQFHLIGFLISQGERVTTLKTLAEVANKKSTFINMLKGRIFEQVFGIEIEQLDETPLDYISKYLSELDYEADGQRIRSILLLFNICSLLQNESSNSRFQFELFKKDVWDIEHVRSVSSSNPGRVDDQKAWLSRLLEYGSSSGTDLDDALGDLLSEVNQLIDNEPFSSEEFTKIYRRCIDYFDKSADPEIENGIGNLALLNAGINRSYKNAVFPIKKQIIVEMSRSGAFVPLCTQNVFLKLYSEETENSLVWQKEDASAYQKAIASTLAAFFGLE